MSLFTEISRFVTDHPQCLLIYLNMKTAYDNPNFARRIYKYKACTLNMTLFKRVLLPDWSVFEKVAVKIKKIGKNGKTGKSNTQRMKKKGYIEDERAEKGFLDSNLTKDKTIANDGVIVIDSNSKTLDELLEGEFNTGMIDAKEAPEESNEDVRMDVARGDDVTGDMEVVEAGDAEGNEAVKDLLKGESNVSGQEDKPTTEVITDDTEILDKGGGRKEKTVRMAGEGDYLI